MNPDDLQRVIVAARERLAAGDFRADPAPGDLVIDPMMIRVDNRAIGWLVDHDDAPYLETTDLPEHVAGPRPLMREVWDILPLCGELGANGRPFRWENAEFVAMPPAVAELARELQRQAGR